MNLYIHPEAQRELLDALVFYRERGGPRIAEEFLQEFEDACRLLRHYPSIGAVWRKSIRLLPIDRFPYSLAYYLEGEAVRIVAIAHQKRRRDFWRRRR